MRKTLPVLFPILVISVAAAASARGLWREVRLMPDSLRQPGRTFTITVKNGDQGMREFTLAVAADKQKPLSPYTDGRLRVSSGKDEIAVVPVSAEEALGLQTYRFQVNARATEHSTFTLHETTSPGGVDHSPESRLRARGRRYERPMGGTSYWFSLRDFLRPAAPTPRR